jgi:antitoxin component YwqK of YwqJK toxin-antitoxin module
MEDMNKFDENGERHGYWKEERYYGGVMYWITNYEHGVKHGIEELQNEAGVVIKSQMYVNGSKKGLHKNNSVNGWRYYYANGNLMFIGNYKNSNRDGYWVSYTDDAQICEKNYYV